MAQRLLNVRVRPGRVAILIDKAADQKDLLLAFEFFRRIWGGRYGQLLAVDPKSCDDLTAFRLGQSRPDFVYGIGLDDDHWKNATAQACQPRGYGRLRPEFFREIRRPLLNRQCGLCVRATEARPGATVAHRRSAGGWEHRRCAME